MCAADSPSSWGGDVCERLSESPLRVSTRRAPLEPLCPSHCLQCRCSQAPLRSQESGGCLARCCLLVESLLSKVPVLAGKMRALVRAPRISPAVKQSAYLAPALPTFWRIESIFTAYATKNLSSSPRLDRLREKLKEEDAAHAGTCPTHGALPDKEVLKTTFPVARRRKRSEPKPGTFFNVEEMLLIEKTLTSSTVFLTRFLAEWLKAVPAEGENYLRLKNTVSRRVCENITHFWAKNSWCRSFLAKKGTKAEVGHCVRRGSLPEHRGVLGGWQGRHGHCDHHDNGRHLHARLQLLCCKDKSDAGAVG